jgi:hypothetical protein
MWTVTDASNNATTCSFTVTVNDTQAPVVTGCPTGVLVNTGEGRTTCDQTATWTEPTATDNCTTGALGYHNRSHAPGSTFPVGQTAVTYVFKDAAGYTTSCSFMVTVVDNTAPVVRLSVDPSSLWPPNHKMRDVQVQTGTSTDNCGGTSGVTNCKVVSVTSNDEPVNGLGDGNTETDWAFTRDGNLTVSLRAERSGTGDGRVYIITVECKDAAGNISTSTVDVRVAHNITAPVAGSSVKIGTTINMAGTFWDVSGNKHTAKWLVDGASVNGTLTEPVGTKNGTVKGSYKLATAGVYKLQMNLTDQKGVTSYATTNGYDEAIVVAYDPNGGYTYGGKKFKSPKGAMPSNPHVAGDMTYGFQTNYYKGATNPKGETWFILNNGDFEFNALNFEYLVVNGAKAQFKGLGKMVRNGIEQSGIAFILTVIDGQLAGGDGTDKIRMKIYNKNTSEVYYDNQPGASDADAPVTVVENNSAGDGVVVVNTTTTTAPVTTAAMPTSRTAEQAEMAPSKFNLKAYPNPSLSQFTIQVDSDNRADKINLRVLDLMGRTVQSFNNVVPNSTLQLGSTYRPGVYIVEMIQGNNRKQLKLLKQPD